VSAGTQLGEILPSPGIGSPRSSQLAQPKCFASTNRFQPLAATIPDYQPLAYVDVEVGTPNSGEPISTRAMVDSGGQGSFINRNLSQTYHLPNVPKSPPVTLVLTDGEPSPHTITHFSPLLLKTGSNTEPYALDITNMAHDIILGIPWLKTHDPSVRFGSETLTFDSAYCHQHCSHYGETIPLHSTPKEEPSIDAILGEEVRDEGARAKTVLPPRNVSKSFRRQVTRDVPSPDVVDEVVPSDTLPTTPKYTKRRQSSVRYHSKTKSKIRRYKTPSPTDVMKPKPPSQPVFAKAPPVPAISVHTFSTLCNQPGAQLYLMSFLPTSPTVEAATAQAGPLAATIPILTYLRYRRNIMSSGTSSVKKRPTSCRPTVRMMTPSTWSQGRLPRGVT